MLLQSEHYHAAYQLHVERRPRAFNYANQSTIRAHSDVLIKLDNSGVLSNKAPTLFGLTIRCIKKLFFPVNDFFYVRSSDSSSFSHPWLMALTITSRFLGLFSLSHFSHFVSFMMPADV
jgi:hypothetical protein